MKQNGQNLSETLTLVFHYLRVSSPRTQNTKYYGMAPNTAAKAVTQPLDHEPETLNPFGRLKSNVMASCGPGPRNTRRECVRLASFRRRWAVDFLDARDLARNGFYYTNDVDIVRCAFCGVEIGFWEKGDDPRREHVKWSPDCDFANGRECGNVPIAGDCGSEPEDDADEETLKCYDTCGPFGIEIRPYSMPERISRDVNSRSLWQDLEHLGVSKTCGPSNPLYGTYESRLITFDSWPADHGPRPEALAEAGFYYLKYHDNTVCFHCGGGLRKWEADDDPWVEHAKWFSDCGFINMKKGKDFVREVLGKNQPVLPAKNEAVIECCTRRNPDAGETSAAAASEKTTAPFDVAPTSNSKEDASLESPCLNGTGKGIELCRICYSREREIVFLPCGHFVSCTNCVVSLTNCAVCRKPFHATCRAYLS